MYVLAVLATDVFWAVSFRKNLRISWHPVIHEGSRDRKTTKPSIMCVTHQMNYKNFKCNDIARIGRYYLALGGTGSVRGSIGWYRMVLGQYGAMLVGKWWYLVSMVRSGPGWYLVALGQYNSVLLGLGIKWYWVSKVLLCLHILTKKRRFSRASPIPHT